MPIPAPATLITPRELASMLRRLGVADPEVELIPEGDDIDPPVARIRSQSFRDRADPEGWVWGLLAEEPLFCPAWVSRVTCSAPGSGA